MWTGPTLRFYCEREVPTCPTCGPAMRPIRSRNFVKKKPEISISSRVRTGSLGSTEQVKY